MGAGRCEEASQRASAQAQRDPKDVTATVRAALLTWKRGDAQGAIQSLRDAVARQPESAELHFQLGTMLAGMDEHEEAELRFTQAVTIDKNNVDALIGLAMCLGTRQSPGDALRHLERAQHLRPWDTRTALLMTIAARAAAQAGTPVAVRAEMPKDREADSDAAIEELSRVIERDPEFADALLALDPGEVDETAFAMLARTMQRAVARNPRHAELHFHCGRVLERVGRTTEAIEAIERAVDLDPRYVKALILLARLYQQTDRYADATTRLEQTVLLGAEFADTYYLLGNLYRDTGQLERARWAYEHALKINSRYEAAQRALASLAA
jgi:tetratricopeptide (TPR) repeat protein